MTIASGAVLSICVKGMAVMICSFTSLLSTTTNSHGRVLQALGAIMAAGELGYGTCWCGCYPLEHRVEAMQKLLDVESIPFAVVAVGEADESPEAKGFLDETRVGGTLGRHGSHDRYADDS